MNILERFEQYLTRREKSPCTVVTYMTGVKQFAEFINKPFEDITKSDINDYIESLEGASSTKALKITILKLFCEWLINKDILPETMERFINRLEKPVVKTEMQFIPSDEEVKAMLSIASWKMKAIIMTYISTSCRFSELANLTMEDIQGITTEIVGKGKKVRDIVFTDECLQAINDYIKYERVDGDTLFTTALGKPVNNNNMNKALKILARKAGIEQYDKVDNHCFRRYFATTMRSKGVDMYLIADMMGHSDIGITRKHYAKAKLEDKIMASRG